MGFTKTKTIILILLLATNVYAGINFGDGSMMGMPTSLVPFVSRTDAINFGLKWQGNREVERLLNEAIKTELDYATMPELEGEISVIEHEMWEDHEIEEHHLKNVELYKLAKEVLNSPIGAGFYSSVTIIKKEKK